LNKKAHRNLFLFIFVEKKKQEKMKLFFKVNYCTQWEEKLYVVGSIPELGELNVEHALPMTYTENGDWEASVKIGSEELSFQYKYVLKDNNQRLIWEAGDYRMVNIEKRNEAIFYDIWRIDIQQKVFCSSAFTQNLMKHTPPSHISPRQYDNSLIFRINVHRVPSHCAVVLLGNQTLLGNWNSDTSLILSQSLCSCWNIEVDASKLTYPVEYKYAIYNLDTRKIVAWESGENRYLLPLKEGKKLLNVKTDENFRFDIPEWKGAGVSIPVFSLRSKNSFGVGEFLDLKKMIDWAKITGQKIIQTLPINDTTITGTKFDSYPYNAISVFALHPMYVNIERMGVIQDPELSESYLNEKKELNKKSYVEYSEVNKLKWKYIKSLYHQAKSSLMLANDRNYKTFFSENKNWLVPYAAFCYLRDQNNTADFNTWGKYAAYNATEIAELSDSNNKEHDDIAIYYYIQYHLHKQLLEVKQYAINNAVVLKGDIPIGISPLSVEAWTEPNLFNMNTSAGAPPDDFSPIGQNWGFPTYNWAEMQKNGYAWWKSRFSKLATYFDAYRIDHILGFFRIWEIPTNAVWGLLGHFNPALPLSKEEIENYGITFDEKRFLEPYIREDNLREMFGAEVEKIKSQFFEKTADKFYRFKKEFDTQKKIEAYFLQLGGNKTVKQLDLIEKLYTLHCEVLFIRDSQNEERYHPRISIFLSHTFNSLDEATKSNMERLYLEYYYHRHNEFWKQQAMKKLPALLACTNMMVCGEDLGMIPDSVPEVMSQLQILSLEIERMPKDIQVEFSDLNSLPYLSVCTTSTHDMSTIRGWWEEDRGVTQNYYNNVLRIYGIAPFDCEPNICKTIIERHLHAPSMWTIIPLQDWFSIDTHLRLKDIHQERINVPSNPKHFWCYRMQIHLEDLLTQENFNKEIKNLIHKSGRNIDL
jgi:4-alpha-glucanotransferase